MQYVILLYPNTECFIIILTSISYCTYFTIHVESTVYVYPFDFCSLLLSSHKLFVLFFY